MQDLTENDIGNYFNLGQIYINGLKYRTLERSMIILNWKGLSYGKL